MSLSRRKAIATVAGLFTGVGVLSAIYTSESGSSSVFAQTPGTIMTEASELPKRVAFTLDPGDFRTYQLTTDGEMDIEVEGLVRWGAELDMLTFPTRTEYQAYANGYRARYNEDLSAFGQLEFEGLSGTIDNTAYLTVDNTDWQGEFPNVVSRRQAEKNEGLTMAETANDSDERSNATGDPSLRNDRGGLTVMGSGENRAKIFIQISRATDTEAAETPSPSS